MSSTIWLGILTTETAIPSTSFSIRFDDDRNGIGFGTNPKGARRDLQTGADGFSRNEDWDGVWYVKAKITEQGWQAEFAIPFKTLRFPEGESQLWGVNFSRKIRRKNEETYWSPIPPPYRLVARLTGRNPRWYRRYRSGT